ncbi:hypothetical protein [Planomonospora sp. ID82291]|uniref:hypothetical protein n=1 Tax=Planomonospora sp. ID82291 TaxID=2738136 RepID=UPI0018C43883|nr:hypothetical protein [Planomonospora sp. ID82291]MBG0818901.1 hypothetical protein [Planomonospora sp. ID82291]
MRHAAGRAAPGWREPAGRAYRGGLATGVGVFGAGALEAATRGNLPMTLACVGMLLGLSVLCLASALLAAVRG